MNLFWYIHFKVLLSNGIWYRSPPGPQFMYLISYNMVLITSWGIIGKETPVHNLVLFLSTRAEGPRSGIGLAR
jgi:hypothetical protein